MDLEDWRNEIDRIDLDILNLLQRRIEICEAIGKVKAKAGLPLIDKEREEFIMNRVLDKRREPLSVESAECIFKCIIYEARRVQTKYLAKVKRTGESSNK